MLALCLHIRGDRVTLPGSFLLVVALKKKEKRAWNDLEKVVGHRDVTKIIAAVCCELVISFSRCYAEGAPGLAANFKVTLVHQDGNK